MEIIMKWIIAGLLAGSTLFASNITTNERIASLLDTTRHNSPKILDKIGKHWSSNQYKGQPHEMRLDIDSKGYFKSYIPEKLKNIKGEAIGSKGKYWVYENVSNACDAWKSIVEENGIKLNPYYPNVCASKNFSGTAAIVLETAIRSKNLFDGFWYVAKFEFKKNDLLSYTNFQGTRNWYIPIAQPISVQLKQEFRQAVYENDTAAMERMLKQEPSINLNEMYLLATEVADLHTVKLLLEKGADVNYKTRFSNPLAQASCDDGNLGKIRYLTDHGADYRQSTLGDISPIYAAAQCRQKKSIDFWLEKGIDINLKKKNGRTPVFDVCRNRKNIFAGTTYYDTLALLHYMVDHGAVPTHRDNDNTTPLHIIAEHGTVEQVQYLLGFYKEINIGNKYLQTPLHYAVHEIAYDNKDRKYEVVKYLLEQGIDKSMKDSRNQTAYDIVMKMSFPDRRIAAMLKP